MEEAAAFQGVPVSSILRTIVVRRAADDYLFVLVPGGRRIHWPRLRALLGVNRMTLPDAEEARAATGYERGTITPVRGDRARGRSSRTPRCATRAGWCSAAVGAA